MSETLTAPRRSHNHEQNGKYSKFQIKGWVNFDATDKTLAEIAEGIEQGDGFLTLMEVLEVDDDLAASIGGQVDLLAVLVGQHEGRGFVSGLQLHDLPR